MEPLWAVRAIAISLLQFFSDPMHMLLAGAVLYVVFMQVRQVVVLEYALYGWPKHSLWEEFGVAAVNGVAVGLVVSIAWAYSGRWIALPLTPFDQATPLLAIAAACGLIGLVVKGRGAFAYGIALVLWLRLVTGWPAVSPTALVWVLGVFNAMEGLLIVLSGASCATPIFLPGQQGVPHGGFSLRRTWPVPFVLPLTLGGHLVLLPMAIVLSYADLAVTHPPATRARGVGLKTLVYAAGLLGAAVAMDKLPGLGWPLAPLMVLGNYFLARPSIDKQMTGRPYLQRPLRGVGVLDVLPGSVAEAAGMRTGDVIVSVDDQTVHNRRELHTALVEGQALVSLHFKTGHDLRHCRLPRTQDGLGGLGAILLPEAGDSHVQFGGPSVLARWVERLRRRLR